MRGDLYIDGLDAFDSFSIGISEGGYNGIVQFQSLKTPPSNNWPEEHGIEVDLSDPKLQNKTFTIKFYGLRDQSVRNFIDFLEEQTYHTFDFREIGVVRILRLTKMNNRFTVRDAKEFELEFADDTYPFDNYSRPSLMPIKSYCLDEISIDGNFLSEYGISLQDGLRDNMLVVGDIKKALTINEPSINSVIYDSGSVIFYSNRDISINMTIHASQVAFWNNWNAFYYDLTRPNERVLYYDVRGETYNVFYKSCSINRFDRLVDESLWCDFTLTLTFSSMQLNELWNLMALTSYGDIMLDSTQLYIDTSIKPNKNPS